MPLATLSVTPDLTDQVYERLLAAIADGTLRPGQRLTQESVAALLGVSRQPVSHALQVLRRRGLVVETGKRGLSVAPIDGQRIRDLYQVREALDAVAARLAAERAAAGRLGAEERSAAMAILEQGLGKAADGTIPSLIDADVAFHSMVYRLSGNAAIAETVAEQWPHFKRSMGQVLTEIKERTRVWREHESILTAILSGKAHRAEELARDHARRAGEETARRLELSSSALSA